MSLIKLLREDIKLGNKMDLAFIAHGHYRKGIEVRREVGFCFECRQSGPLLVFDNSDEECTPMQFCLDCLNKFGDGYTSSSTLENDVRNL